MKARKENKVYTITEQQKQRYLNEGFDVYDDDGNVVEYSPKKVVKYSDHIAALAEAKKANGNDEQLKALEEENASLMEEINALKEAGTPEVKNVTELLSAYAESKKIDVGSATTAKGILEKITEAEKA